MQLKTAAPIESSPLREEALPQPEPRAGQVRLRVTACGLCHTDLHVIEGELPPARRPVVPGHQIVGIVDKAGPGADTPVPGTRVGVAWLQQTDETCDYCRRGQENLCPQAVFTGYHVDGGLAEYTVAPADFVYALPEGVPDVQAAPLLCAGIIGYRALKHSGVRPGEQLGLYGFGASAHIAIQIANWWGCEVLVCTRSERHRQHALELGAVWVGGAHELSPESLDAAVCFAPAGQLVPLVLRALRPGGTVALAGIYMSRIPELDYSLLCRERVLRTVANSTRQDGHELLDLAARIPLRTDVMLYPLESANQGLQDLKHSRLRGAAVISLTS